MGLFNFLFGSRDNLDDCVFVQNDKFPDDAVFVGVVDDFNRRSLAIPAYDAEGRRVSRLGTNAKDAPVIPSAEISLPETVKSISWGFFSKCKKLEKITVDAKNSLFRVENDALVSKSGLLIAYPCAKRVTQYRIPDCVREIRGKAFANPELAEIVLPDNFENADPDSFTNMDPIFNVKEGTSAHRWVDASGWRYRLIGSSDIRSSRQRGKLWFSFNQVFETIPDHDDPASTLIKGFNLDALRSFQCNQTDWSFPVRYNDKRVKGLDFRAFGDCREFVFVSFAEGWTFVKSQAFQRCPNLTRVKLPASMNKIEGNAFCNCPELRIVEFEPDSKLITIDTAAFCGCGKLSAFNFPATLQKIGQDAFRGTGLTKVELPRNVDALGAGAFSACANLEEAEIGVKITEIPERLFCDCAKLRAVKKTPPEAKTIGQKAFYGCASLTSVFLPNRLQRIESEAFAGCKSLKALNIPPTTSYIADNAFADSSVKLRGAQGSYAETWARQHGFAFEANGVDPSAFIFDVENVEPNGVKIVGLKEQTFLKEGALVVPATVGGKLVVAIGDGAFEENPAIESIELPGALREICANAFRGCLKLKTAAIPASVETIGDGAFRECARLVNVAFSPDGALRRIGAEAFCGCSALTAPTLPLNVEELGARAFERCASIIKFWIPEGITKLSDRLFYGCSSLSSVVLPEGLVEIGTDAFRRCKSLSAADIPGSVRKIGKGAFANCVALTQATLRAGLAEIDAFAFYNCASLQNLALPETLESLGEYSFSACAALKSVVFPSSLAAIGHGSFMNCRALVEAKVPSGVKRIGETAFYNCASLETIALPHTIDTIDEKAFEKCDRLTIQAWIDSYAFQWASVNKMRVNSL